MVGRPRRDPRSHRPSLGLVTGVSGMPTALPGACQAQGLAGDG